MATDVNSPQAAPPPPPPPAPKVSVAKQAAKDIAAVKTGFDPLRPFRYVGKFIGGTVRDGLNGMAGGGQFGLKFGGGIGVIAAIAMGAIGPLLICAAIGFAMGAAGGTTYGLITGGTRAVARQRRGEIYAEDLVEREKIQKAAPSSGRDYRQAYQAQQRRANYINQQVLEREAEVRRDTQTYWQDREANRAHHSRGIWG